MRSRCWRWPICFRACRFRTGNPPLIAALVLGLVNAVIRPILVMLTLPVTILTLGLFLLVINALLFWAVASLIPGFNVGGFGAAFIGALLYTVITWLVDADSGPAKGQG